MTSKVRSVSCPGDLFKVIPEEGITAQFTRGLHEEGKFLLFEGDFVVFLEYAPAFGMRSSSGRALVLSHLGVGYVYWENLIGV